MNEREPPKLDTRRSEEFRAELTTRARAWIRDWSLDESPGGFGAALVDVAARFSAQVAERLDRAGEKLSLGLLDWLAVRANAAKPARMPVAFKLADAAREPVLAKKPVRLQADVDGASVVFETETDVNLVPGTLAQLVGIDTTADAYFLPPPGISSLAPLEPLPDRWTLKNYADQGANKLQLDPALGLVEGTFIEIAEHQYRVQKAEGDLVTLQSGIQDAGGLERGTPVTRVLKFDPFGGPAHNEQQHIVYLGDKDLFNIEAAATFEILGANGKLSAATWQYWGKSATEDEAKWRDLPHAPDAEQVPAALKLKKPIGSVEPTDVGTVKGVRWIRALQTTVSNDDVLETEALTVVVNRRGDAALCPSPGTDTDASAPAEGFTNATALVVSSVFYPLGKEPKQFDTFYLGCTDAFSKKKADVSICFELADVSAASFAAVRTGASANRVLASVGADGALHLFNVNATTGALSDYVGREPLQPKSAAGTAMSLDLKPTYRLPVWTREDNPLVNNLLAILLPGFSARATFSVAVSAGNAVWVRMEAIFWPLSSRWIAYNALPPAQNNAKVDALAYLPNANDNLSVLLAAYGGKLFSHSSQETRGSEAWAPLALTGAAAVDDKLRIIAPVHELNTPIPTPAFASGIVAVLEHADGTLGIYLADAAGKCVAVKANSLGLVAATQPAAARIGNEFYVFWHVSDLGEKLRAVRVTFDPTPSPPTWTVGASKVSQISSDPAAALVGGSLEIQNIGGDAAVVFVTRNDGASSLTTWAPFAPLASTASFEAKLPAGNGPLAGAPTVFDHFVVAPGAQADAWIAAWDPTLRKRIQVTVGTGVVVPTASTPLLMGDFIGLATSATTAQRARVADFGTVLGEERFHALDANIGVNVAGPQLLAYRTASGGTALASGAVTSDTMVLDASDHSTVVGEWLLVQIGANNFKLCLVSVVNRPAGAWDVVFFPDPGLPAVASLSYWHANALPGRIAPHFSLTPTGNGNWNAALLDRLELVFEVAVPSRQRGKAFRKDIFNRPELVVLDENWTTAPPAPATFLLDAALGTWQRQLGDSTSNPELAWEFWNGTNWTQLALEADETLNLKQTGRLDFTVPVTLAPTDVAGKTNYWIRARLIGGDYGREKIKVITKPVGTDGTTEQTVERSPADIRPPLVVRMRVRYGVSNEATPSFLLTQDSGSLRDQSDANRTPGALVEAFVPVSVLMQRLLASQLPDAESTNSDATGGCSCASVGQPPPRSPPVAPATADSAGTTTTPGDRAILLGVDAGLYGEPINVLLLVDERPHDGFAPLAVEALVKDRFEALTVKDTTRALGESGVLSMAFPVKPSPRDLFGRSLTWLRLSPSRSDASAQWRPIIRGAYLNAAWASATETLTREPLGSSDGRPLLTLRVARPPLLQNSLELRVREPLDEEERKALLDADTTADPDTKSVEFDIPDLPGNWVLWKQVPDPADCGPHERVYALDETLGEVTFGDGVHGMIPPIGRDAVVAFSYQRTEPAADGGDRVPANDVVARTALNLVTPVESVEGAFAADHAAGGAPPESTQRVLRFGNARLRHRERAIVPRDFADLALASSPDIAQARAFKRAGALKIVVIMRGDEPAPTAGQRRELRHLLQQSASPLLGDTAITIEAPHVRRLRLRLKLRVTSLDDAGETATDVKQALTRFFDSASGGVDGAGWPLGVAPAEDDIALALADARGLESIEQIRLIEIAADGSELPWRAAVRADELVMLATDAVRIDFATLEAEA